MYSSTSARSALISIRLAPSRTMASRSESRSDRSSSPTTMLNMGVPSMDGLSAALGLQQTGGYATLLSPNSIHNFGLYPVGLGGEALHRGALADPTGVPAGEAEILLQLSRKEPVEGREVLGPGTARPARIEEKRTDPLSWMGGWMLDHRQADGRALRLGVVERHLRIGALESPGEWVGTGLPVEYRHRWSSGGERDRFGRRGRNCNA